MTSYCKWSIVYLVFRRGKCCKGATPDFITKCDGLLLKSATEQRFNHVELPKYGYMHVGTEKTYMELWSFPVL